MKEAKTLGHEAKILGQQAKTLNCKRKAFCIATILFYKINGKNIHIISRKMADYKTANLCYAAQS